MSSNAFYETLKIFLFIETRNGIKIWKSQREINVSKLINFVRILYLQVFPSL